jgi:hypothetical protein
MGKVAPLCGQPKGRLWKLFRSWAPRPGWKFRSWATRLCLTCGWQVASRWLAGGQNRVKKISTHGARLWSKDTICSCIYRSCMGWGWIGADKEGMVVAHATMDGGCQLATSFGQRLRPLEFAVWPQLWSIKTICGSCSPTSSLMGFMRPSTFYKDLSESA